jgi:uncharacterized protein YdeI (BOF family)
MVFLNNSSRRSILAILFASACIGMYGCAGRSERVLGVSPASVVTASVKDLRHTDTGKQVTISGEMTEKCPIAGCWFMLKDKTGVVRVDTKASGFVVSDVPLHSLVTVSGSVTSDSEHTVTASGLRY